MESRGSGVGDEPHPGHRLDVLLRGVAEISTLSGIEWLREVVRAWLPDVSPDRARVERAIETRAVIIGDAEAARPLLDFNWTPAPGPMDRIIDRLQQRGPRLMRDEVDQDSESITRSAST